jgi:hypothetical protein
MAGFEGRGWGQCQRGAAAIAVARSALIGTCIVLLFGSLMVGCHLQVVR